MRWVKNITQKKQIFSSLTLATSFGGFWGTWAFMSNRSYGFGIAIHSGLAQAIFSFVTTLFFTNLVDRFFLQSDSLRAKIVYAFLLPIGGMTLGLSTLHYFIGTKSILATVAPPLGFMAIYCLQKIVRYNMGLRSNFELSPPRFRRHLGWANPRGNEQTNRLMSIRPAITNTIKIRGQNLVFHKWLPTNSPRAAVIVAHGWGDHSGRYDEFARFLTAGHYVVYCLDFEGHGLSNGKRGFVANFSDVVDDLAALIDKVEAEISDIPLYLCGYSMGGCACAMYVAFRRHSIAGVVFIATALVASRNVSRATKAILRILGRNLPSLPLTRVMSGMTITRDVDEIAKYERDELVYHGKISAATGRQFLLASECVEKHLHRIAIPLLVLHGARDPFADSEGAKALYVQSPSRDKAYRIYDEAFHDLLHETNRKQVMADLKAWLDARTELSPN